MSLNPQLKEGDRVVCYYMEGETSNVPIGTTGTVTKIVRVPFGMGIQYSVKWDNDSTLDLIPETDAWDFESENVLGESMEKFVNVLVDDGLNPDDFEEEITKLNDDDITDEFLRNIDRKLLKSGDKTENVKKYIDKYLKSLETRKDIESEPNDDFDEDEFMYGSEEPIKSKIGKKQYIKELMPMQVELLKLQEMVKNSGKPFVVVFEGHFKRNYIHLDDVVQAFNLALDNQSDFSGGVFNVGLSEANISKIELCEKIKEIIPSFTFLEAPFGKDPDQRNYIVSNEKLE